jgi:non-ribosomal peptide synthetase component E (peptide arylation enzyme)
VAGWNLADILEVVAREVPDSPAIIQGSRVLSFESLDARANEVADYLTRRGLEHQAKVAQYLRNSGVDPGVLQGFFCAVEHQLSLRSY